MSTPAGTITVWQSGRLAPQARARRFEITGAHWLGAALLALAVFVFALFVAVLQGAVARGELQHAARRSRAVAEAQCETEQPARQRGRCLALFDGDQLAAKAPAEAPPGNALYEQENAARGTTVSLVSGR